LPSSSGQILMAGWERLALLSSLITKDIGMVAELDAKAERANISG